MIKFFSKTKGVVSVFLVIILVPMMVISALFVDASRVQLAGSVATSAGDLALNTALTDYDSLLKDMYGLFATAQNTDDLYEKLEDYYKTCITSSGVSSSDADSYVNQIMSQLGMVAESKDTNDILNMQVTDFTVSKRTDTSLANASILKNQVVNFMKYRAPINTGLGFLSSLSSFTTLSKQTELVDKRTEYYKEQQTVMETAQSAWKYINEYNKSGFVNDENYFSDMKNNFDGYESEYKSLAKKLIKDLYDTQSYSGFTNYSYYISNEKIEINGEEIEAAVFYTNSDRTSKLDTYNELSDYSDRKKATSDDIKKCLEDYYEAFNEYKTAESNLPEYNGNTYGLQFLVQINRKNTYENWVFAMKNLYEKYSKLKNAYENAATKESGDSVTEDYYTICDETNSHKLSYYYDKSMNDFDVLAGNFDSVISGYNNTLQGYANNADTSTDATASRITELYNQINGYRATIKNAKDNIESAIPYLNSVKEKIKSDGSLKQKESEWKTFASSSDLKNTTMAKQDLAEINNLSSYLREGDVDNLINRLNNINSHLGNMLNEIDSYTFFGTPIGEISDYSTFTYILSRSIGDNALKNVSTDSTELDNQADSWCNGQYSVGSSVDVSWENQSGTQANLIKDKLEFYSYLYTHFNVGDVSTSTEEKTENTSSDNGKALYNSIKDKSKSDAESRATTPAAKSSNEIKSGADLPSGGSGGSQTASASVSAGDSAAKDTSNSLKSMFSGLADNIVGMAMELRDNFYFSEYVMGMFSYDTIEKENEKEHPGTTVNSITLTPINSDNNYAYGSEVEYIIYGGSNGENLAKAYGSIYGIRLGFNLIYAFSSSEIRETAFAMATPISAATLGVIPVPLIQAGIIIGLACCESGLDLTNLKDGEKVPLFKNKETWQLSITGLIDYAKGKAGEIAKNVDAKVIDESQKEISKLLDMTDEEINKDIDETKKKLDRYLGNAYDTLIERHANTVIQKLTTLANNAIEEYAVNPSIDKVNYVSSALDSWLAEEANNVDTSTDIAYIVKSQAVNYVKQNCIEKVITAIDNAGKNVQGNVEDISNQLSGVLSSVRQDISEEIDKDVTKIAEYKSQMINEVKNSLNDGADKLKETLNSKIDGIFGTSNAGGSIGDADNTAMASILSFSYSDYLRLFMIIGLYTNEKGVILRTADAIQLNMAKQPNRSGFKMSKASMYVELTATIQIKPTLLALPLFADVNGNPKDNTNWYTIEYKNIKGY